MPERSKRHKPIRNPGDIQMSISIDRELKEKIRVRAKALQRSMSGYLRYLAEKDLASVGITFPNSNHGSAFMNERPEKEDQ